MKLLFKAMLRHIKRHVWQTVFTFFITVLIIAMLSVVFHFASSFQMLLREYALEAEGSHHYWYEAQKTNMGAQILRQMAEDFRKDRFFAEVALEETGSSVELKLTVASPGLFTSKTMEKKFNSHVAEYRMTHDSQGALTVSSRHNYELLVSYGDLHKENGMYAYLMVFFLMIGIISAASVLTLGAVFRVSAVQRERDFALLISAGADGKQIRGMVLAESAFYIIFALPLGYLLGIFFFEISRGEIDNMLYALQKFPPIQLVISVPYSAVMVVCAVLVILGSAWKPADRAAKLHPIEALRQTKSIYVSEREQKKETTIATAKRFGMAGWLARKNQKRFQRRYRPLLLAMTVTIVLCFVLNGFQKFTTEIVNMMYGGRSNNISIELYSDDMESLEALAERLIANAPDKLSPVREVCFALQQPYPLSEEGEEMLATDFVQLPDIMLFSVDEKTYHEICRSAGVEPASGATGKIEGIYIDTERIWMADGVVQKGNLFEISKGSVIKMTQNPSAGAEEEGIEITVAGVWNEFPLHTNTEVPVRVAMLVSQATLTALEPLRPYAEQEAGLYHISLRGLAEDADKTEREAESLIAGQSTVIGKIENYDKEFRQEKASIAGFRYLMTALILLLVLVCICGNFIVSWTIGKARQKEFATLVSIGMTPREIRNMRWLEQVIHSGYALLPGSVTGLLCYQYIYHLYSEVFGIDWCFPWEGLGMSLIILAFSAGLTELLMKMVLKSNAIAELLRADEI